jgi:hypothetical protein
MEQNTTPLSGHDTAKDRLRTTIWARLKAQGAAVGEPGPGGRGHVARCHAARTAVVALDEMSPIDLVVVGCVAVARDGGRTGKGAGFADLELGLLRQQG